MRNLKTMTALSMLTMLSAGAHAQLCTPNQVNAVSNPRTGQLIHDGDILYAVGQNGLSVYLASDPASPGLIASLPLGGASAGYGLRIGNTLYAANGSGSLHAIDISDPAHPVGVIQAPTSAFIEDLLAVGPWLVQANFIGQHQIIDPLTLAVVGTLPGIAAETTPIPSDDGRLWAAAANEIRVYDIDAAGQPTLAVAFPALVQASSFGIVRDGVLYVSEASISADCDLSIIDLADLQAPIVRSTVPIGGGTRGEFFLEGSQLTIGTNDLVTIVDTTDIDDPFVVTRFSAPAETVAPVGSFLFTGSTSATPALRIFDRSGCPALPVIIGQPESVLAEGVGDSAELRVSALLAGSYQWFRNGAPVADGSGFTGSATPVLTVVATRETQGLYRVVVSNPQGSTVSAEVGLVVETDCAADLAAPFGVLNIFDIQEYINQYNAGCP